MPNRPFAYICSPFRGDIEVNTQLARGYSRRVFDAGYTPLAGHLLFPQFLSESDPAQRQAGLEMGLDLLAQCSLLVVCGDRITEGMAAEIQRAAELEIPAAVLEELLARDETPRRGFHGDPGRLSAYVVNPRLTDPMGHLDTSLQFPVTRAGFREALDFLRIEDPIGGNYYFHSPNGGADRLRDYLPYPIQQDALDEVNYFAARLEALSAEDRTRLTSCLEVGLDTGSMKGLHNLLHKLAGEYPQKKYNGPQDVPWEYRVFTEPLEKTAKRSLLGQVGRHTARSGTPEKPPAPGHGPEL